jgi:hypothetical protein
MSLGRREFSGGYDDLSGALFGTALVQSYAGRGAGNAPRWNVECTRCSARYVENHANLTLSGEAYRCRNTSCNLPKIIEPERIEREPVPAPPKPVSADEAQYNLYVQYARKQGLGNDDIASWEDWKRLDQPFRNRLSAPAELGRQAEIERKEQEALSSALEANELLRMKRQYGLGNPPQEEAGPIVRRGEGHGGF